MEGNCEWTLTFKQQSCEEFLLEMTNLGKDLATLDAATVGKISINKVNRNKWHVDRMFLHFLRKTPLLPWCDSQEIRRANFAVGHFPTAFAKISKINETAFLKKHQKDFKIN